jgi:predicted GIY-YIG superfamily endonuclease
MKRNNCIVYIHKRKLDGMVFYVGISTNYKRPYQSKRSQKFWMDYTKKYDYDVEIIREGLSWEDACEVEMDLISKYGRRDLGEGQLVNMTNGGDGTIGYKDTPSRIEQKRKYMLTNNPMDTQKSRKKVSLAKLGMKRPDLAERNKDESYQKKCVDGFMKFLKTEKGKQYLKENSERVSGDKNPSKRDDVRKILSVAQTAYQASLTEEERRLRTLNSINKRVTCEHCGVETNKGNYSRWHGDNCKRKK